MQRTFGSPGRYAIVLAADAHYLPPAMALATHLRRAIGSREVAIVVASADPRALAVAAPVAGEVELLALEPAALAGLPEGGHVSRAAFVKLLAADALAPRFERVLLLDVDTAVTDPDALARLFGLDLGGATFAGTIDVSFFIPEPHAPGPTRAYRSALGLAADTPYVNTGVLLVHTARWRDAALAARSLAYARAHPERCRCQEQSALNALVAGDWLQLSPRWNFAALYESAWYRAIVKPVVLHYLGPNKPWHDLRFPGERAVTRELARYLATSPWPRYLHEQRRLADVWPWTRRRLEGRLARALGWRPDAVEPWLHPAKARWLLTTPFADIVQGFGPPFVAPGAGDQ